MVMDGENIIGERKERALTILKNPRVWVVGFLIAALVLGIYIRSLPMHTRPETGKPGLWDVATDDWTLGPDLDPWLFLRYAETITKEGSLPEVDDMRYVPLGYEVARETRLLPYMIAGTYFFFNTFTTVNIEYAGAIFPVIMFGLTILAFFLFVKEIFIGKREKEKKRAYIIAIISTFFMIVLPVFLSRTVAGIPEKESAGFFFMFLAFYLFLKAWKSRDKNWPHIFAALAGISTALMGLIWGGVIFVFVAIASSTLIAFILNKIHKREFIIYSIWLVSSLAIILFSSAKFSFMGLLTSINTGLAFLVFFIMAVHFTIWRTKLKENKYLQNSKLPKNILSLIIAIVGGIVLVSIFLGPSFIFDKISSLNQMLFKPVEGRWVTTVAENKQPYFREWAREFGPLVKDIPIMFWMFFIGSIVLFRKMLDKIKKKDAWILTFLYVLFFFGLVFSRYSSSSTFNGINFISKTFYYLTVLLLIGGLISYYVSYHKKKEGGFKEIKYEYIFLFSFFILALFSARSAVRLIMMIATVAPIFAAFLIVTSIERFRKTNDEIMKMILGGFVIILLLSAGYAFWTYQNTVKQQAYSFIPGSYHQQWQKAMFWVRENTPEESTVFAHWWDYGYWVQSIGKRATVLDGGNSIKYWNYLMGRHVLTGDNEKDALDFLYSHKATHLLIDSSDLGKYGAFSQIGSDENFDRFSSGPPIFLTNNQQIRETAEGVTRMYTNKNSGGYNIYPISEDLIYFENGTEFFFPSKKAGVFGISIETSENNGSISFNQPKALFYNNGAQKEIPLRYLSFGGEFIDFKTGVKGTAYVMASVDANGRIDSFGTAMYLSPRLMRGMLAQKYILNDPFNNFPHIKEKYSQQAAIVENLRMQGTNVGEFVYFYGLRGPIKIWEVEYTGKEEVKEEYLDRDYTKYLSWEL